MKSTLPKLCYITDRRALDPEPLLAVIVETIRAGVDFIQIREKDLNTRELLKLAESAMEASRGTATRIVVNDRLDIALATGAQGVHLGVQSMPTDRVRARVPVGFWIGVSCHSAQDVQAAEAAGADYALLGPIFETPSKLPYGPALGLEELERAARASAIPVLALGGLTLERIESCLAAGAAGIAGISIFQKAGSAAERVREIRARLDRA